MKLQNETTSGRAVHGRWYDDACGTAFGLELIGERWALLVVRELMLGPRRFSDLRASLPGISAKVLTERLATLATNGIVVRRDLPPPVRAQVYELTAYGLAAEPLIQELGRWAAMSPLHDPTLPLSPVSFMLSLRTMFDQERAKGWQARVGFRFPHDRFVVSLADGHVPVERGLFEDCDAVFIAKEAPPLAAVFYGGAGPEDVGVGLDGDRAVADRFVDVFQLPDPIG